jgi:Cu/Ag efflux protein CusF
MLRPFLCAAFAHTLAAGGLRADTVTGKVKTVDADKSNITVQDGDKDVTYTVAKDAKVTGLFGKGKKVKPQDLEGGLKGVKEGVDVSLTVVKTDDKDSVTEVKVTTPMKKKKKTSQ